MQGMRGKRIWLAALGLLLAMPASRAAETVTYYLTDAQGSVIMTEDAQGNTTGEYDYRPYGAAQPGPAAPGPGYTGHVQDPDTGLVYMQARYYDPQVGRFLSVDPISPAPGNVFNINRYDYVNNSPLVNTDPTGMCGGSGEVTAKTQAIRDTSDGCMGSATRTSAIASATTLVKAFGIGTNTYYVYADNTVIVQSGNRNSRDNNPGNLRQGKKGSVSRKYAAGWDYNPTRSGDNITKSDPFAIFPTLSVGEKAQIELLRSDLYKSKTILQAMNTYAPRADNNDPTAYANFLSKAVGGRVSVNTVMGSLTDPQMRLFQKAQEQYEGFRAPRVKIYLNGIGPF